MKQIRARRVTDRSQRGSGRGLWRTGAALTVAALVAAPVALAPQAAEAAPFPTGAATVYIAQDIPTQLFSAVNVNNQLEFQPVGPNSGVTYNALAYHVPSDHLYALVTGNLVRIESNGSLHPVATSLGGSNAGAFSGQFADRYYYRTATELRWYNVANGNSGSAALSQTFGPADFAWSNGYFWGLSFDQIDANSTPTMYRMAVGGTVTTFPVPGITRQNFVTSNPNFGGAWTYGNGNLGFTNNGGGTVQIAMTNAGATPTFEVISFMDGPASGNNDAAASPGSPIDLSIAKSVDKAEAQLGESLRYELTVTNETAASLSSGYTVKDTLPAHLGITAGTLPERCTVDGAVSTGQTISCAEAPLAGGASRTLAFDVTVQGTALRGSTLDNVATVIGNEEDKNSANNTDSASTVVVAPILTLAKSVSYDDANDNGNPDLGEDITWTFRVTNSGDFDATGVSIADSRVAAISPPSRDIAKGAVGVFTATLPATQQVIDAGVYTNTATASGVAAGKPYLTNSSTARLNARALPGLQSVKSASLNDGNGNGVADAGETIDFTLTVTNTGNVTLAGVTASDSLLPLAPASVATLAPQQVQLFTGIYEVTEADVLAGAVQNTASAAGTTPGGETVPSEPSTTRTETIREGITVVKSALDPDMLIDTVGSEVRYRFVVTNTGNTALTGVTVNDPQLDAGSLDPLNASIPAGGQFVFEGTHTVTQQDIDNPSGRFENTATATGTPVGNTPITSTPSTVTTPLVEHLPATETVKTAELSTDPNGNGKGDLGDVIRYTVTVTNTGNVTLSNIIVTDPKMPIVADSVIAALAPGEFEAISYDYTVTQADVDRGSVANLATTASTGPGGEAVPPSEDETITPTGGDPLLHAVKSASLDDTNANGFADEGETIAYSVRVWNLGEVTAADVTIDDPMAGAFAPALTSIAPGGSQLFTAVDGYTVTAADVEGGGVFNSAVARGVDPRDPGSPLESPPTTTETATPAPQLSIQKIATLNDGNGNGLADVGESISYSFVVTNGGNILIEDITVADPMVSGLAPASFDLAAGRTQFVTALAYTVTDADVLAGTVANSATVTGTPLGGTPVTPPPSTTTTTTVLAEASFTSVKNATLGDGNGNGFADVGETIQYSFLVTNTGTMTILGVTVGDARVSGIAPASQDVAPGQTIGFSSEPYTVTQADVDAGGVFNVATVSGNTPGGDPLTPDHPESEVPTPVAAPALSTVKSSTLNDTNGNSVADEGETIEYTVTVRNTGNVTLGDVAPVDAMVAGFTPATAELAPGQEQAFVAEPYTVTAADVAAGVVANTATSVGTPPGGTPIEGPPSTVSSPTVDPGMLISKSADLNDVNGNGVADLGETISYSFLVSNTGNTVLENVSVSDPMVTGLSPASATLPVGESLTFTAEPYAVTEQDILAQSISNTAVASGQVPGTPPFQSPPSTVTVPPAPVSPALAIEKSALLDDANGNGFADEGEIIQFSFLVSNTGNVTQRDVAVQDEMVTGLTTQLVEALRPGQSVTVAADPYTVTAADVAAGRVHNVATATGTAPSGNPATPTTPTRSPADSVTVSTTTPQAHTETVDVLARTGVSAVWPLACGAAVLLLAGIALFLRRQHSAA